MTYRYRAVGLDRRAPDPDGLGPDRDEGAWTFDPEQAQEDQDAMLTGEKPPFDEVVVEMQEITHGPIQVRRGSSRSATPRGTGA